MKREAPDLRRFRLKQLWHRKFAWLPKVVCGQQIWLEHYWQRYEPMRPPKTEIEWMLWNMRMTAATHGIYVEHGRWHFSLAPPDVETGDVIQFPRLKGN